MRILVVEDDPRLPAVLRQGLIEQCSTVDVAPDGDAGLSRAEREHDAIVLDVMRTSRWPA